MLSQMKVLELAKTHKMSPEKVCRIADVCDKYGIQVYGSVFKRTPEDLESIILTLKENNLNPNEYRMAFCKKPEAVQDIIDICKNNRLKIEAHLFGRKAEQLKDSIHYVKSHYGDFYVTSSIVAKDVDKLKVSMPIFKTMGLLRYTRLDASVFELSREEIMERTGVLTYLGEKLHRYGRDTGEDRINHVYVLSEESFDSFCYVNGVHKPTRQRQAERVEKIIKAAEMEEAAKKSVK